MAATLARSTSSREQIALFAFAAGIADHAGGAADQRDRPMPGPLEPPQHHQGHQMADVQAIGRGIEADIERARLGGQPAGQARVVSRLMNQAAPAEIGEISCIDA